MQAVRDNSAKYFIVEVVVNEKHSVICGSSFGGSVNVAVVKVLVCRTKGRLHVVVVLRKNVRYFGSVGMII